MTNQSDMTMPVALAAGLPVLLVRLGAVYVRLKVKRRSAIRVFRRELLRVGMGRDAAERLAAEFASYGRLRTYVKDGEGLRFLPFAR